MRWYLAHATKCNNQHIFDYCFYCYVAAFLDIIQMKNHFRISFFVRRKLIHFFIAYLKQKTCDFLMTYNFFPPKILPILWFSQISTNTLFKILWSYHFVVLLTSYSTCVFQTSNLIVCCYIHIFWSFIFLPIFIGWYLYLVK